MYLAIPARTDWTMKGGSSGFPRLHKARQGLSGAHCFCLLVTSSAYRSIEPLESAHTRTHTNTDTHFEDELNRHLLCTRKQLYPFGGHAQRVAAYTSLDPGTLLVIPTFWWSKRVIFIWPSWCIFTAASLPRCSPLVNGKRHVFHRRCYIDGAAVSLQVLLLTPRCPLHAVLFPTGNVVRWSEQARGKSYQRPGKHQNDPYIPGKRS